MAMQILHTQAETTGSDETIVTASKFVYNGGGFIGVGEPAAHQYEGHFFQLATVMGVEEENGFTLNVDKYNWEEHDHFITEDCQGEIDFGEGKKRASLHWTVQRSSNRLTKKYSLQSMSLDRDAAFTSADFHIVSKTADCYIVPSSGLLMMKKICISGSALTTM